MNGISALPFFGNNVFSFKSVTTMASMPDKNMIIMDAKNPPNGPAIAANSNVILANTKASAKPNNLHIGNRYHIRENRKAEPNNLNVLSPAAINAAMAQANPIRCFPLVTVIFFLSSFAQRNR